MASYEATAVALKACLDKLKVGGAADAGVKTVLRGRVRPVTSGMRNALVLVDGDDGDDNAGILIRERHGIAAGKAEDVGEFTIWGECEGPEETVGTTRNALLEAVVQQLATDADLAAALGPHGRIKKLGTVRESEESEEGAVARFGLSIGIIYILNPSNPAAG